MKTFLTGQQKKGKDFGNIFIIYESTLPMPFLLELILT